MKYFIILICQYFKSKCPNKSTFYSFISHLSIYHFKLSFISFILDNKITRPKTICDNIGK